MTRAFPFGVLAASGVFFGALFLAPGCASLLGADFDRPGIANDEDGGPPANRDGSDGSSPPDSATNPTPSPTITGLVDQAVQLGMTATFAVKAEGAGSLTYEWSKRGSFISGATSASYTTPPTTSADDDALFNILVRDSHGKSVEGSARLRVTPGTFTSVGALGTTRLRPTAIVLPNGSVLVAGGYSAGVALATAELYDAAAAAFAPTGPMSISRGDAAPLLTPNGKVLFAGGATGTDIAATATAELYDPALRAFAPIASSLASARIAHTTTLLPDGKVLIVGGADTSRKSEATSELFDPATSTFSPTGSLHEARYLHTATLLPNGKVLVVGGYGTTSSLASAELYDPATGHFTDAGFLSYARRVHTATALPNGNVLLAGGYDGERGSIGNAELYDWRTGTFSIVSPTLGSPRYNHKATLLPNGRVLLIGGTSTPPGGIADSGPLLASGELFDPATGVFVPTRGSLAAPRAYHAQALLPDGKVLVVGGSSSATEYVSPGELYW